MRFTSSAVLFLLVQSAAAFLPPSSSRVSQQHAVVWATRMAAEKDVDISVPYDAAARLAYEEWRTAFNKGAYTEERYQNFRNNYEAITIANVVAKKRARETGSDKPVPLMTLNEYGDFSEAEYKAMKSGKKSTTTGNVLEKALEAAKSQSEASAALRDAADALAEEEQELAAKLGLGSVEELENALDSLEGIGDDGVATDENLAREARVRAAYMEWCRQFDKKQDEKRYQIFEKNYLTMEEYSKKTEKEMNLNQYADYTKEEFEEMIAKKAEKVVESKEKSAAEARAAKKAEEDAAAAREAAAAEAKARKEVQDAIAARAREQAQAKLEAEKLKAAQEAEKAKAAKARLFEIQKKNLEVAKAKAEAEANRRAAIEKERADRQKQQELEAAQAKAAAEAAFIAAAREEAKREAARAAERRRVEQAAAELARKRALAADQALKKASVSVSLKPKPPKPPKAAVVQEKMNELKSPFASFFSPAKPKSVTIPKKVATPPKPVPKASPSLSIFSPPPAAPKVAAPVEKKSFFSFFGGSPAPVKAPEPEKKKDIRVPNQSGTINLLLAGIKKAESKPKEDVKVPNRAGTLNIFGGTSEPKSRAAAKVAQSSGTINLLGGAIKPKPQTSSPPKVSSSPSIPLFKVAPTKPNPAKSELQKAAQDVPKKSPTISLFSTPKPKAPQVPPAQEKSSSRPTFSLFGEPKPKPSVPPVEPVTSKPAAKPAATFSLFGESKPKAAVAPSEPAPPVKSSSTFSLFGSSKPKAPVAPVEPTPAAKSAAKPAATFSLFGFAKPKAPESSTAAKSVPIQKPVVTGPPAGVPTLSRWKQNSDGSITGFISGSPNFKAGEKVTTSPVKGGAKAGTVVKTGSGSQYYLK